MAPDGDAALQRRPAALQRIAILVLARQRRTRVVDAVVNRDMPDFALVAGVPARQISWMSRHGERLDLPLAGNGEALCSATGERYVLRNGVCGLAV